MRLILLLVAILSSCGCMTKTVNLYLDVSNTGNCTISINDSQEKPLDVLHDIEAKIPGTI